MIEKITKALGELENIDKQRFYVRFSNNLTIIIRGVWSDESNSIETQIKMIKIINECQHRILNHALSLYDGDSTWSDIQVFDKIKALASKDSSVAAEIGGALKLTMNASKIKE